ncbi:MAG: HD domain-containing phosphohydrolase, partial [Candidatus Brocadiales bacterium]
ATCPCLYRKEIAGEKGYVSALYVPLKAREKIYGCLGVISKGPRNYSPSTVSTLEAMCTIAASFLESARNYKVLEDKGQELGRKVEALRVMTEIDRSILLKIDNLNELFEGVTHLIGRLIPCDRVTIVMLDKVRGGFVYGYGWGTKIREKGDFVPFEHTNATQAVMEKRPIIRNDIRLVSELLPLDKQFLEEGFLSDFRVPIMLENEVIALLNIGSKRVAGFRAEDVSIAEGVASQLALAFSHTILIQKLKDSLLETVKCLSEAIDAKSPWTRGHSERVARLSCDIARELGFKEKDAGGIEEAFVNIAKRIGLKEEEVDVGRIEMASLLHDVGKIGTIEGVLDKPGKLTPEEWDLVKQHCARGVQIIRPVERFNSLIPMILYHHEHYDGKGYPEGIEGEKIPLGARIIGVADAVDAMCSERPYRKAKPIEEVVEELKKNAGTQFCPKVVEAALRVLERQKAKG